MDEVIERTIEQQFHGVDYIIRLAATTDYLTVDLEQRNSGDLWRNQFAASYIEDITSKTGNFKKYPVFLKMLLSSLSRQSDSVVLDILSYQDLEMLKQKKNHYPGSSSQTKLAPSNKRYLILTYVVEFDKVHYPLPLNFDENPPVEQMKATISQLRAEIDQLKVSPQVQQSNDALKHENELLKTKLKKMEETVYQLRSNETGASIYQRQIDEQNKEIVSYRGMCDQKDREILELRNQLHRLKQESVSAGELIESVKRQQELEKALIDTNKKLFELEDEVGNLVEENRSLKLMDKKAKTRVNQLEQELQSTLQKSNSKRKMISSSPVGRKSSSLQSRKSPMVFTSKRSGQKDTPTRRKSSRNNSVDSDTESSYQRRKQLPSPSLRRKLPESPAHQPQKLASKRSQPRQPSSSKPTRQTINLAQLKKENVVQDEEERLKQKLIELRQRNKENLMLHSPASSQPNKSMMSQSSLQRSKLQLPSDFSQSEEVASLDERMHKLQSLLKMVKDN